MPIGPKGPPQKPGLSLRGRLVFDTFSGIPRVRPWPQSKPTKPGSKRQFTARTFGAANRACKITEATWYGDNWAATRGTPLLPRDLMIAFMYGRAVALQLEDGRIIRSMAARNDVSQSLDLIANAEGMMLIRGPKYWEALPAPETVTRRATLYRTVDGPVHNYSNGEPMVFDGVLEDIGEWADLAAHPTRLTVPFGVESVMTQGKFVAAGAGTASVGIVQIRKNGNDIGPPMAEQMGPRLGNTINVSAASGAIPVQPGDYFELVVYTIGDSTTFALANRTWLSIQAV